jgi:hypothetical protein
MRTALCTAVVLTAGVALGVVLLLGMLLDPADVGAVG